MTGRPFDRLVRLNVLRDRLVFAHRAVPLLAQYTPVPLHHKTRPDSEQSLSQGDLPLDTLLGHSVPRVHPWGKGGIVAVSFLRRPSVRRFSTGSFYLNSGLSRARCGVGPTTKEATCRTGGMHVQCR